MESRSSVIWNDKVYRSYETERAGKRGKPSPRYALTHPFPTYNAFGAPQFVDMQYRQYRIGDGMDALEFEKSNNGQTNINWNPNGTQYIPGRLQFMYIRCPRNVNSKRTSSQGKLVIPNVGEDLILIHLNTKVIYTCEVQSSYSGPSSEYKPCGSLVITSIARLGVAKDEVAKRVKDNLQKKYKKLIKV